MQTPSGRGLFRFRLQTMLVITTNIRRVFLES
jgi:hypothetical protein